MSASAAAAVALFWALSSLAMTLLFLAYLRIPEDRPAPRPTLVLPVTGLAPGLEDLLNALAAQSLPPQRLIIVVESREDPAYARVAALVERYAKLNIELVLAGLSQVRSQKCTNLLAALANLRAGDAYIVLFDVDIRPQPWWLAALVGPLAADRADIVNGYRWPVPTTLSPGAVLVASIDRAIAALPRLRRLRAIWGGSVAFTRHALEVLDLPTTIGRTLTEDLPVGSRAAETGLRVLTRRAIRPLTPLGGGSGDLWRFGRRQYQLIRLYRPGLWRFAAFLVTTDLAARLALLATAIGLSAGKPAFAVAAVVLIGCLGSLAVELRIVIGKRLGAADMRGCRLMQHLFAWAILPVPAFHASVIWGGFVTSPVLWAHVRYIVDRAGRVIDVMRRPHSERPL